MPAKPHILLCPLDWGLGHTTRCIPIIKALLQAGCKVTLGGNNVQKKIFSEAFPNLKVLDLDGYNVSYSKHGKSFNFKILLQTAKIAKAIANEHKWLKKVVQEHAIDAVVSDNRFGLHHKNIHSIFITHQLNIHTGNKEIDKVARKINYNYIEKFDECWVPDYAGDLNLSGKLGHPSKLPKISLSYIGLLSRFALPNEAQPSFENDLLVIFSGPEPQRSIFEQKVFAEIKNLPCKIAVARGLPGQSEKINIGNHKIFNHLPAPDLQQEILKSAHIIARAGYSTIMDLVALKKNALLVPTPGQGEQEYLVGLYKEKQLFPTQTQGEFSIMAAMDVLKNHATPVFINDGLLEKAIAGLAEKIRAQ